MLKETGLNIIVKEVGQGMGPESIESLLKLPIGAVEFGAFGGTNFASLELARSEEARKDYYGPIAKIGHNAYEMVDFVNSISSQSGIKCENLVVSGGITSFLDGYYLISKSRIPAVYGQASSFLRHAKESYEQLKDFVEHQIEGLKIANAYFRVR
jgi:isopentenyl-diphosphate delta-isomerase